MHDRRIRAVAVRPASMAALRPCGHHRRIRAVTRLVGGFLVASIAGAVVLLVLIALRRLSLKSAVPFGPVLIAAAIVAALLP